MGAIKLVGLPVKLSETLGNPLGHAPELGEHIEAILTGCSVIAGKTWRG